MAQAERDDQAPESALTEGDLKYLLALCVAGKRRWQKRFDHAASHGAIERREYAVGAVQSIEEVMGRLQSDLSHFTGARKGDS